MRSWKRGLRDSGSEPEGDTRVRDGGRRRETTVGGDGEGSKGDGSQRIYARQWEKVRQVSKEELMKWTADGSGDAYAVHGGKIVTPRMINQFEDGAMIRLVSRLLGGGGRKKKVAPRNKDGSDMSATDESSSF